MDEETGVPIAPPMLGECMPADTMVMSSCCWPQLNTAETRNFAGTVHFIFQPAKKTKAVGVMVEEGLFEQFPSSQVFGMHNWPGPLTCRRIRRA